MIDKYEKEDCVGCGACMQVCPTGSISMKEDEEGFRYPEIDSEKCCRCQACEQSCPIEKSYYSFDIDCYAVRARERKMQMDASSGGVFGLLAEEVLKNGGVVFGAILDEEFEVKHIGIQSLYELPRLCKSKYVQSNTESTYAECRKAIEQGRVVLYAGTPCQIAGLNAYLGQKKEKLYLVDIICHGVPNAKLWKRYLKEHEGKIGKKIKKYDFRYKSCDQTGINEFSILIQYEDGEEKIVPLAKDAYFQGFSKNLYLRRSCSDCKFKGLQSGADITLGDYWGIQLEHKDFADSYGNSAVIIETPQGRRLFERIKDRCFWKNTAIEKISRHNTVFISERKNEQREKFFNDLQNSKAGFESSVLIALNQIKAKKVTVNVWGSYNSRVAVVESGNLLRKQYSNMSLISQTAAPVADKDASILLFPENPYRKEMMSYDLQKPLLNKDSVFWNRIDYLIIDFLEERFDIQQCGQTYITVSDAFMERNDASEQKMKLWDKNRMKLWEDSCDIFIDILRHKIPHENVILCRMFLTENIGLNQSLVPMENRRQIEKINEVLEKMYRYFQEKFRPIWTMEVKQQHNFCHRFHMYGCLPQHLNYKAYGDLGEQFNKIVKERNER